MRTRLFSSGRNSSRRAESVLYKRSGMINAKLTIVNYSARGSAAAALGSLRTQPAAHRDGVVDPGDERQRKGEPHAAVLDPINRGVAPDLIEQDGKNCRHLHDRVGFSPNRSEEHTSELQS